MELRLGSRRDAYNVITNYDEDYDFEVTNDFNPLNIPNLWNHKTGKKNIPFIKKGLQGSNYFIAGGYLSERQGSRENIISSDEFVVLVDKNSSKNLEEKLVINYSKEELLKEVLSFKALNNNWDGYGALPLELDSAANVINLMNLIDDKAIAKLDGIYPNPNGTISLIWNRLDNSEISLEVGNNTMSYYVLIPDEEPIFCNKIDINTLEANILTKYIQAL